MAEGIWITLDRPRIAYKSGDSPAIVELTVGNFTPVVDQVVLRVAGLDPRWFSLSAEPVSLFPGDTTKVVFVIHPTPDALAGTHTFEVLALSRQDPAQRGSASAALEVAEYGGVAVDMVPRSLLARRSSHTVVTLRSQSNTDRYVRIEAADHDARLRYQFASDELVVPAGGEASTRLDIRAKRLAWGGFRRWHQFRLSLYLADSPVLVPMGEGVGEFHQMALLPGRGLFLPMLRRMLIFIFTLGVLISIYSWQIGKPGDRGPRSPENPVFTPTPTMNPIFVAATVQAVREATASATQAAVAAGGAATGGASGGGASSGGGGGAGGGGAAGGAGGGGAPAGPTPTPIPTPIISSLTMLLSPDGYSDTVPLTYQVHGATDVQVQPSEEEPGPAEPYQAVERVDYTLTATNDGGSNTRTYTIFYLRPPLIDTFEANHPVIRRGTGARLTWSVQRALRVFLDDKPLADPTVGFLDVSPTGTRTYELRAENSVGETSQTVTVTVVSQEALQTLTAQASATPRASTSPQATPPAPAR